MQQIAMDFNQVAEALSVSRRTVERLAEKGELATVAIGSRRRVTRRALEDYIDRLSGRHQQEAA